MLFTTKGCCEVYTIQGQTIDFGQKNKGQIRDRTSKSMEEIGNSTSRRDFDLSSINYTACTKST